MTAQRSPDSPENPHAGQGSVMLDIGGDIGAVVVTMPESMVGQEVDIVRVDASLHGHGPDHHALDHGHGHGHGHRPHVAVVRRPVASGGDVASLVYPEVVEGRYRLLEKGTDVDDGGAVLEVDVVGGQVTMVAWPD